MNVILTGPLHEKAFRSDDTFAHAKKRMLKGRVLGKGVSANTKRQTGKCTRNNPPPPSFYPHEDISQTLTAAETLTCTCGFYC